MICEAAFCLLVFAKGGQIALPYDDYGVCKLARVEAILQDGSVTALCLPREREGITVRVRLKSDGGELGALLTPSEAHKLEAAGVAEIIKE